MTTSFDDNRTEAAAPRGRDSHAHRLEGSFAEEERAARRVMDAPVAGPRGQQMSLTEAERYAHALQNRIDMDEARNSLRHRTVSTLMKVTTFVFLAVIDFPIMLWLTTSVFNVDWADPIGLRLAISVVISLLGTTGSAWVLYHLGHNQREAKNDKRQLRWSALSGGAKVSLLVAGVLVALITVVMFVRVYTEAVLSELSSLALLLAVLIAVIMMISAALVFFTAVRDGSPEQEDLAHYSRLVQAGLERKRAHEDRADRLRTELSMLLGQKVSTGSRAAQDEPDSRSSNGASQVDRATVRATGTTDPRGHYEDLIPSPRPTNRIRRSVR